MNAKVDALMKDAITSNVFPSAELLAAVDGEVVFHEHYGSSRKNTAFDISSLTKPVCTASLAMMLIAEGLLKLEDTVYDWLGGARRPVHRQMTVEHLLRHTSGLPAWQPYYRELPLSLSGTDSGRRFILDACYQEPNIASPGEKEIYSDIGYIILGEIVSQAGGAPLNLLFNQMIASPLKLTDTSFVQNIGSAFSTTKRRTDTTAGQHIPTPKEAAPAHEKIMRRRFAPTEDCPWRERVIHGEVHDQNAYALGGVAGHSGLFSTASDLNNFLSELIKSYGGGGGFFPNDELKRFVDARIEGHEYVLGWDTPSKRNSAAGKYFSNKSIGHLGYTGCSMWLDLEKKFWIVLLSNRIHPSATNEKIRAFRPRIHDLLYGEVLGVPSTKYQVQSTRTR